MIRPTFMFLGMLFLHASLVATGISPLAFKNVFQCFNKGYEYCCPALGSAALSTGIIENLRFYNINATYRNENREYAQDKPSGNDSIMNIIKILFPSPAGQLATEGAADTNFGGLCIEPKFVASLINFSYATRKYLGKPKQPPLPSNIMKIIEKIGMKNFFKDEFPKEIFKHTEINKLLTSIVNAIQSENTAKSAGSDVTFYPKYFVEQVLSAFFCHKFAQQSEIKDLLKALNSNIVDQSKIDAIDGLIEESDLQSAQSNVETSMFTLDDIWLVLNHDIFSRVLPYKGGKTPISNGLTNFYRRDVGDGTLSDNNKTFPDCVEVSLRHICNFLLYNQKDHIFDLTLLDSYMGGKDATYYTNFKNFYTIQDPSKADAGSSGIRSAWNKVVADLGKDSKVCYNRKFYPKYDEETIKGLDNNNELDTGMINIMRVFKTLFVLDVGPEPVFLASDSEKFKSETQKWVKECIDKLCAALNPSKVCSVNFSETSVCSKRKDFLGNIALEILNKSDKKKLFNFTIRVLPSHIDIQNLHIVPPQNKIVITQSIKEKIGAAVISDENSKTTIPILLLLDTTIAEDKIKNLCVIYQILSEPINDSISIRMSLNKICKLLEANKIQGFSYLVKNILMAYPWSDWESVKQIIKDKILKNLVNLNMFKEELKDAVGGYCYHDQDIPAEIATSFPNIKFLHPPIGTYFGEDYTFRWKKEGEAIDLSLLPKLQKFTMRGYFEMKLAVKHESLKYLSIEEFDYVVSELNIGKFISLCPNLNSVNLSNIKSKTSLKQANPLTNLKELSLETAIDEIDLDNYPNLERLVLLRCHCMKIKQTKPLSSLQFLLIQYPLIEMINFDNFPNVETIRIYEIPGLTSFVITKQNKHLTELSISQLPEILEIDLSYFPNLEKLNIAQLVGLKKIIGIENCPKLNKANLQAQFPGVQFVEADHLSSGLLDLQKNLESLKQKLQNLQDSLTLLSGKL